MQCVAQRKCKKVRVSYIAPIDIFGCTCSVLQCVAVYCSALQCDAVCCSVLQCVAQNKCQIARLSYIAPMCCSVLQGVAVCCSVLQCIAVCQCVAVCCSVLKGETVCCDMIRCIAVCYNSALQCLAMCCSPYSVLQCVTAIDVLQSIAVYCSLLQCFTTSKYKIQLNHCDVIEILLPSCVCVF